ncbi:hypothetical protein Vau01_034080 [Virgisporangium aurantiacum]|uniref:Uncharacterized protein n=2 Tax=Virgisporangium aurantiacum TaxID=175570 RepID=A0A8J3Z390_9ACTN|nr:hypothetical protein Vau01_034080 [Virgisporangium aurantiacum]
MSTLSAVMGPVGAGYQLFNSASNLVGTWTGSGQQAQGSQAGGLLGKGQQVLTAFTQSQQIINAGAQQLQNAKARLVLLTKTATTQGFQVWPMGKVVLGKPQIEAIAALHASQHHGEARTLHADLTVKAGEYTAQIDLVVLQTNAADAQVALTLANSAVSVLGSLTQKDPAAASTPPVGAVPPPTSVAPGPLTPNTPITPGGGPTLPTGIGTGAGPGVGLAGVGSLDGAGLARGLTGAGGVPLGTAGLNPSTLGGTAGLGPGAIAARGGAVGEMVAGGGAAGGPGMMYGGAGMAGGHLGDKEHHEGSEWLEEEGASWETADAATEAGGVLS